ncbi:MAG: hypothetical protein PHV17_06770 [Candidatus Omnitrophica bacterium]|nr:hypothetical protein [Candidatus Omnitrophota bacterium]
MRVARKVSELRKDYIASYLRSQIFQLQCVLKNIEDSDNLNEKQVQELLNKVRRGFYQFRTSYN